jgi:hypothetical protein
MRRLSVVVALAAVAEALLAGAAHAQGTWPPLAPAAAPPPVAGPRVILTVDNPNGRLQQHMQLRWRDICLAPCGATLDPSALYRVGGGTSLASEPFTLGRTSGDLYIDAHVGSKVKHFVGLGLMIGGAVAAGYGALFWAIHQDIESSSGSQDNAARNLGLFCFGVAAALEIAGGVMFFDSTSVQMR